MNDDSELSSQERWARLRFAIIGPLLAAPPEAGHLQPALAAVAAKSWRHPISGAPTQFGYSTLERWFYRARNTPQDPVGALRPRRRRDAGQPRRLSGALVQALQGQYRAHPSWSYQLHYDNLAAVVAQDPRLEPLPSYATLRRYMKAHGLFNLLASARFDSRQLLSVVLAGDQRLNDKRRREELVPLGSRIRTRLNCTLSAVEVEDWRRNQDGDDQLKVTRASLVFVVLGQDSSAHPAPQQGASKGPAIFGIPKRVQNMNNDEIAPMNIHQQCLTNSYHPPLSPAELRRQNRIHAESGGVSAGNRDQGFEPAFIDRETGRSYRACFADGRPAPMHLLDGLPESLVESRCPNGRVTRLKQSVEAGFLRRERFFTRTQVARALRLAQQITICRQGGNL